MRLFENKKKTEEYKKRAHDLVAQMTLEEKVSQMLFNAPAIERLGVPAYNWWNEALHGVARAGTATVFPQAIAMAAAFDEELVHEVADAVSTEARGKFNAQQQFGDRDIYKGLTTRPMERTPSSPGAWAAPSSMACRGTTRTI